MASRRPELFWIAAAAILLLAGWLRFFDLGSKPIHADEAVQAWKLGDLLETGRYRYDPVDHHGPTLYYLAAPVAWLAGERDVGSLRITTLRALTAAGGLALVAATLCLFPWIGRTAALLAAAFTAVSPLQVFYSRHFIQEPFLVLLTILGALTGWMWFKSGRLRWAVALSACFGLTIATKETWLLVAGAVFVGGALASGLKFRGALTFTRGHHSRWLLPLMALGTLTPVVALFSAFFADPGALLDVARGLVTGVERSAGGIHDKPWNAYASILLWHKAGGRLWTEAGIAVFAVGSIGVAIRGSARLPDASAVTRFLWGFSVSLAVVLALIPYKTIWLACGFWHGFSILAGIGAAAFVGTERSHTVRMVAGVITLAVLCHLGVQAWRTAGPLAARPSNPYAYVQTSTDALRIPRRLAAIAAVHPRGRELIVKVALPEYWPLPWLLRDYPRVGFWLEAPDDLSADVLFVSPEIFAALPEERKQTLATEFFGLRDGVLVILAVDRNVWNLTIPWGNARDPAR